MEETPSITCTSCLPARRGFTRAEYMLAAEVGILKPDERLELIEGEIYLKMSPQKAPHATTIRLVENALNRIFSEGHDVRVQLPLALGERSEPEPDVAVVAGSLWDYQIEHPTTAELVIEVSDTTLAT